jgi:rhamnosyltransferase
MRKLSDVGELVLPFKVAVLLACYNGEKYVEKQIETILNQEGCDVKIFVSDDHSTDSTRQILSSMLGKHPGKIVISQTQNRSYSAGANFYQLISAFDCCGFDYVAFSDQDDIWESRHLVSAISISCLSCCDGVSSNVLALYPDGNQKLYRKNQPQRKYDFLFESPGPGCSFVITKRLFNYIRDVFDKNSDLVRAVFHHDWLIYAAARSANYRWFIREEALVRYRQHSNNETGARIGLKSIYLRFKKITSGWYANQVHNVALVVGATRVMEGDQLLECLCKRRNRFLLLKWINETRRSAYDRFVLMLSVLMGWIM